MGKSMKERLDVLLVQRNLVESREKAKAIIMSGNVFVEGQREDKAGSMFPPEVNIEVKGASMKYVSRGGFKLEKAIQQHGVILDNKVCMDVGSSTGGFTDCMLQNGATKVFAVDVGTNQLAWKLRQDPRVVSMEKTNIRYVTIEDIKEFVDFVSIDVAFISLTKVLGPVFKLMKEHGEIVCLIKPQFEAGREKVGKKGVVREKSVHDEVIRKVVLFAAKLGFEMLTLDYSPIKGPEGNIEYLLYMRKQTKFAIDESKDELADFEDDQDTIVDATLEGDFEDSFEDLIKQRTDVGNLLDLVDIVVENAHGNLEL